jgi:hypothetical protein
MAWQALRICVMCPVFPWMRGPYQMQAGLLARALQTKGHEVFFMTHGSFEVRLVCCGLVDLWLRNAAE